MSQSGILSDNSTPAADVETLTGNSGGAVSPTANNINVVGSGNITIVGNPGTSTLTAQNNQFLLATNYTEVAFGASPYTVLATDYYVSLNTSGGAITIRLPNAPTSSRIFVIKDRTGNAAANNVTVTTVGGAVNIDGSTSYTLNQNYASVQLIFNGTSYEVF